MWMWTVSRSVGIAVVVVVVVFDDQLRVRASFARYDLLGGGRLNTGSAVNIR